MKRKYQQQQKQQKKQQDQILTQVAPNLKLDMSIISQTNRRIQLKCPQISIELMVKDATNLVLALFKNELPISTIKINVCSDSITISSYTYEGEYRNKKYNSILRSILILLALSMRFKSKPIRYIYSDAINWKTIKTLNQRNFVPIQIYANQSPYFIQINSQIFTLINNTQRLKQMLSGDEHDERKPWLYIRMELDLQNETMKISQSTKNSLTNSITSMTC